MKRSGMWCIVVTVALSSLGSAADLKIAVVDFHRAFAAYGLTTELQKQLDGRKKEMNEKLAQLEKSLKSKQSDLESFQPGSDKYREFQLKLIELEALIPVTRRQYELELEQLQRSLTQRVLADLEKELRVYAGENKIDLVLAKFIADPRFSGPLFVTLYHKPELDITAQIIERLNRKVPAKTKAVPKAGK